MIDWRKAIVSPSASIHDAIAALDAGAAQICLVVDDEDHLLGVVTDGNIRRGLLTGVALEAPVVQVMNPHPVTLKDTEDRESASVLMRSRQVRQIPIVDTGNRIVDLVLDEGFETTRHSNEVVLMAGGLGTRLGELTTETPKPLIRVGPKPILETILERFLAHGFDRFRISVNYLADQIIDHFGDGSAWGARIDYLHETERLGTAGALGLLDRLPDETFFVMNGDILTMVDFEKMLRFHGEHDGIATAAIREYDVRVPYGVVETRGSRIERIVEKPVHRFFVNAGIYLLEPSVLDLVPRGVPFDMPELMEALLDADMGIHSFPVHEFWLDIGRRSDLDRAQESYIVEFDE